MDGPICRCLFHKVIHKGGLASAAGGGGLERGDTVVSAVRASDIIRAQRRPSLRL